MQGFDQLGGDHSTVLKYFDVGPHSLSVDEREAYQRFRGQFLHQVEALERIRDGWASEADRRVAETLRESAQGPYRLTAVEQHVWSTLIKLGCNPAGPQPSRQTDEGVFWQDLIDWENLYPQRQTAWRSKQSAAKFPRASASILPKRMCRDTLCP